jgi:hypothetical protein
MVISFCSVVLAGPTSCYVGRVVVGRGVAEVEAMSGPTGAISLTDTAARRVTASVWGRRAPGRTNIARFRPAGRLSTPLKGHSRRTDRRLSLSDAYAKSMHMLSGYNGRAQSRGETSIAGLR